MSAADPQVPAGPALPASLRELHGRLAENARGARLAGMIDLTGLRRLKAPAAGVADVYERLERDVAGLLRAHVDDQPPPTPGLYVEHGAELLPVQGEARTADEAAAAFWDGEGWRALGLDAAPAQVVIALGVAATHARYAQDVGDAVAMQLERALAEDGQDAALVRAAGALGPALQAALGPLVAGLLARSGFTYGRPFLYFDRTVFPHPEGETR